MQAQSLFGLLALIDCPHFAGLLDLVPLGIEKRTFQSELLTQANYNDLLEYSLLFLSWLNDIPLSKAAFINLFLLIICSFLNKSLQLQAEIVYFFHSFYLYVVFRAEFVHPHIDFVEILVRVGMYCGGAVDICEVVTEHFGIGDQLASLAQPLTSLGSQLIQSFLPFLSLHPLDDLLLLLLVLHVY